MAKHYFTFGMAHIHNVNGKHFGFDTVAEINAVDRDDARNIMVAYFGTKWAFQYADLSDLVPAYYKAENVIEVNPSNRERTEPTF